MADMTAEQVVVEVWREIMGDANLLDGLTVGRFSTFMEAVSALMDTYPDELVKAIPIGLAIRFMEIGEKTFGEQVEVSREYLRLKTVDDLLDGLAGIDPDD